MLPRSCRTLLFASSIGWMVAGSGCVRKQFFQLDARPDSQVGQALAPDTDSVRGVTAGRQYAQHGGLYDKLVGWHHRRTWAAPVTAAVLHLPQVLPGGLRPGKVGGGFNSTSLNLTSPTGAAYVLRTVDKDPIRATPKFLQKSFLVNVLRDNISSTHPYAALVVPPLAQAAGVPRAVPRLFYVQSNDPVFQGDSLRLFRGQLAYLEEKAAVLANQPTASRNGILGSEAAFAQVFAQPSQQLDQAALLRARLLDGWLGDWDRHPGQWNWAPGTAGPAGTGMLMPLPKDRDMVFYRLDDGLVGWLIGHVAIRHWTTFRPRYPNPNNLMSSGRYLDTRGLNRLSRAQFLGAARLMQQQLPDSLIARAVRNIPPAAFSLEGPPLIAALQARRDALPGFAEAFYSRLARRVVAGGTAQAERFEVHRHPDSTVVTIHATPLGLAPPILIYHRTFYPTETRSIQLEGLGGNDIFLVKEHGSKPIKQPQIQMYGGAGDDKLQMATRGRGVQFSQGSAPAKRAYDQPPVE